MALPTFPVIVVSSGGGGTTPGVTDIQVTNEWAVSSDGDGGFNCPLGVATLDGDGVPVVQAIVMLNVGGTVMTTAHKLDTGGGATKASLAAKIKASIDMGPLAALLVSSLVTTAEEDDTCRLTAVGVGPGSTIGVDTPSEGLAVVITEGG